jgi:hypothetical protein
MAGEDAIIELEDEGVVTINIGADPDLAAAADKLAGGEVVTTKEKPGAAEVQRTSKPSAADEAAAVLTQSLKTAEEGRKAAEATANAERTARLTTERTLSQRDQEAKDLRETAASAELQTITTGITNATRDVETLTAEIERANEAGDFKASAAASAKMARAAAALDRLETDKINFETRKPAPSTEGRVVEQPASPLERYVSVFAPRAQTWLRAHPECVPAQVGGNAAKNSMMMAGHHEALAKGLEEGSDEYFRVIEEKTGYREPVSAAAEVVLAGEPKPKVVPQIQQRRPAPSAPPSRDGEQTGATQRSVRLSPAQQETALFSYTIKPGETEAAWKARALGTYARELVAAQAEGKIGRMTH